LRTIIVVKGKQLTVMTTQLVACLLLPALSQNFAVAVLLLHQGYTLIAKCDLFAPLLIFLQRTDSLTLSHGFLKTVFFHVLHSSVPGGGWMHHTAVVQNQGKVPPHRLKTPLRCAARRV
jgi:hypothetical protein